MELAHQIQEDLFKLGYSSLNPMQEKAVAEGLLENFKTVVAAPTASGKTLLALMKIASCLGKGKKAVYVVPLRALASEKLHEFQKAFAPWNATVAMSTGDLDGSSAHLKAFDVVVVTVEKLDSLMRHDAGWLKDVGLVVVDEVHLLNDQSRGATLEVVLTKVRQAGCSLLALSATLPNAREVADWLDAKLIESKYRPTELVLGLCDSRKLYFPDSVTLVSEPAPHHLVSLALSEKQGKAQCLVFVSTRRLTQSLARELSAVTGKLLSPEERLQCAELSEKVLKALPTPTEQCRELASCLANGVAFHNAGIESKQRLLIEQGFKHLHCVKAIVCTTTLAMGVDYPASWVIVRDLKRFNGAYAEFLPALEVAQMTGRAGRPRYDKRGIAVLLCSQADLRKARDKYVLGGIEELYSKLASEPLLRTHCLGLIASGYCASFAGLYAFFKATLYAHQFKDFDALYSLVEKVVLELKGNDLVREKNGALIATPVGKRVSELYLDPLSAVSFLEFVHSKDKGEFDFLLALNNATEARPLVGVSKKEENALCEEAYAVMDDLGGFNALEKYKSAKLLNAWINEATEDDVLKNFDIPPGVLHARVKIMEWLAYSIQEMAFMLNQTESYVLAKQMRRRIRHGIKKELLSICSVRGIGRVRGRKLFKAGITTAEKLNSMSKNEVKKILAGK